MEHKCIKSKPSLSTWIVMFWKTWRRLTTPRSVRELRLCESLALGEKRFVAIVAVGSRRYLVGGTSTALSLLGELPASDRDGR